VSEHTARCSLLQATGRLVSFLCSALLVIHEFIDLLDRGRQPAVDTFEALTYTVPGVIGHQSALRSGMLMKIPQYPRPT
jgi:hypothetical protein